MDLKEALHNRTRWGRVLHEHEKGNKKPTIAPREGKKNPYDRTLQWREKWSNDGGGYFDAIGQDLPCPKIDAKPSKTKLDAEPNCSSNWWSPKPSARTQRNLKGFDCRCTRCCKRYTQYHSSYLTETEEQVQRPTWRNFINSNRRHSSRTTKNFRGRQSNKF